MAVVTIDEAKAVLEKSHDYISPEGDEVILDGWFNIEQLEAILLLLKAGLL